MALIQTTHQFARGYKWTLDYDQYFLTDADLQAYLNQPYTTPGLSVTVISPFKFGLINEDGTDFIQIYPASISGNGVGLYVVSDVTVGTLNV